MQLMRAIAEGLVDKRERKLTRESHCRCCKAATGVRLCNVVGCALQVADAKKKRGKFLNWIGLRVQLNGRVRGSPRTLNT